MRYRVKREPLPSSILCGHNKWQYESDDPSYWRSSADSLYYTYGLSRRDGISSDRCYDQLHAGPPYLTGGPLDVWKVRDWGFNLQSQGDYVSPWAGPYRNRYIGGFICTYEPKSTDFEIGFSTNHVGSQDYLSSQSDVFGNVSSLGAVGWNKYRPGQPGAGAAQFLAEISQVPRMLKTTAFGFKDAYERRFGHNPRRDAKKAADHWLNHQYGWIPFVSDLQDFSKTWKQSDSMIKQLRQDNDQWIKRSGSVRVDRDVEVLEEKDGENFHYPDLSMSSRLNPQYPYRGWWRIARTKSQDAWFTARFKYHIPDIQSVNWERKARAKLYGLDLTPSLVWELTPWSWLVDWGSNVGDVFANMDNQLADNLVAKYAYISGRTTTRVDVTSHMPFVKPLTNTWSYQIQRRQRVAANPFGFGLTGDDLTARQFSILGALGITRMF